MEALSPIDWTLLLLFGTMVILVMVLVIQMMSHWRLTDQVREYQNTYRTKEGTLDGYGEYRLISVDGGKNWHLCQRQPDGGIIITGPADAELLERLEAGNKAFSQTIGGTTWM